MWRKTVERWAGLQEATKEKDVGKKRKNEQAKQEKKINGNERRKERMNGGYNENHRKKGKDKNTERP